MAQSPNDLTAIQLWVRNLQIKAERSFTTFQNSFQFWLQQNGGNRNLLITATAVATGVGATKILEFLIHSARHRHTLVQLLYWWFFFCVFLSSIMYWRLKHGNENLYSKIFLD